MTARRHLLLGRRLLVHLLAALAVGLDVLLFAAGAAVGPPEATDAENVAGFEDAFELVIRNGGLAAVHVLDEDLEGPVADFRGEDLWLEYGLYELSINVSWNVDGFPRI